MKRRYLSALLLMGACTMGSLAAAYYFTARTSRTFVVDAPTAISGYFEMRDGDQPAATYFVILSGVKSDLALPKGTKTHRRRDWEIEDFGPVEVLAIDWGPRRTIIAHPAKFTMRVTRDQAVRLEHAQRHGRVWFECCAPAQRPVSFLSKCRQWIGFGS